MRMRHADKKSKPGKSSVNLSIDSELLAQAKALGINLSEACERELRHLVRARESKRWLEENRAWIESYNADVERRGVWSDGKRLF
jgi:antitoxin CcdA